MDRPTFERKPIPQPKERRRVANSTLPYHLRRFESEVYYRRTVIKGRREQGLRLINKYLNETFPMEGLEGEAWSVQYGKRSDEATALHKDLEASLKGLPMESVN